MNFELLVDLFGALLLGMLLGMVLLSLNVATLLQRALAFALVRWWERDFVGSLLDKNIKAPRGRHRKTVVVFAVSVAFIIFLNVSYNIQIDETRYAAQQRAGADLLLEPSGLTGPLLDNAAREALLASAMSNDVRFSRFESDLAV